jgi:hypothetical protein
MLAEIEEVAVKAINSEGMRADKESARADTAMELRELSEASLKAAEERMAAAEEKSAAAEREKEAAKERMGAAEEQSAVANSQCEQALHLKKRALAAKRTAESKSASLRKVEAENRRLRAKPGGVEYKGMEVKMWKCRGGIGDNAPNAQAALDYAIETGIAEMKADDPWKEFTPEQKQASLQFEIMRCANHGNHKVAEASVRFETKVLNELMAGVDGDRTAVAELVDLPTLVREADLKCDELDQPTAVGAVLRATSKLFAPQGEHHAYFLNEYAHLVKWQENHADPKIRNFKLQPIPSYKGSRQMILLEIAAAIAKNRWIYVTYMKEERQEGSPNKLVEAVRVGLSNRYILAAVHARTHVFISFSAPSRFVLNHLATRPTLHGIMECMEDVVENLPRLLRDGITNRLFDKVGAFEPSWKEEMDTWRKGVAPYHDALAVIVNSSEFKDNTLFFLDATTQPMKESIARNWKDKDYSGDKSMEHAPVNTDHVESTFGTLGQVSTCTNITMFESRILAK